MWIAILISNLFIFQLILVDNTLMEQLISQEHFTMVHPQQSRYIKTIILCIFLFCKHKGTYQVFKLISNLNTYFDKCLRHASLHASSKFYLYEGRSSIFRIISRDKFYFQDTKFKIIEKFYIATYKYLQHTAILRSFSWQ